MDGFFAPGPVMVGEAPGRLDVMGGIADYSGATVLQLPLACRTTVMMQQQAEPLCDVVTWRHGAWQRCALPMAELEGGALRHPSALAAWFRARPDERWAAYVVGVVQWCLRVRDKAPGLGRPISGLRLLIVSNVPEAQGVASSAALEVATMTVVAPQLGIEMLPAAQALACQQVEHQVVGAPCGIMDQMTSACGQADRLLRLKCQPARIEALLRVPDGYRFYGITSGERHAVTGADYETVRTAAFMGYGIIAAEARLASAPDGQGGVRVTDPRWHGYLANVTLDELADFERILPQRLAGDTFLERHGGITDRVTRVRRERNYPVRSATVHPIREQARILHFASLLEGTMGNAEARELGRLMRQSHDGYGDCGLGSRATDRLVALAEEAGPGDGVFGAKITGGGSGGTVAVLGTMEAEATVREIARRYSAETGRASQVLVKSGPGAHELRVETLDAPEALHHAERIRRA